MHLDPAFPLRPVLPVQFGEGPGALDGLGVIAVLQHRVPADDLFGLGERPVGRAHLAGADLREAGLTLSAAEAALLQSLLKRPNKILTREQLIGERELDPFDRSIDVRISRLRRKLEDDPQDPKIIKTVYGAGYLLAATVTWS